MHDKNGTPLNEGDTVSYSRDLRMDDWDTCKAVIKFENVGFFGYRVGKAQGLSMEWISKHCIKVEEPKNETD